jgi:hypothetical protein
MKGIINNKLTNRNNSVNSFIFFDVVKNKTKYTGVKITKTNVALVVFNTNDF